MIGSLATSRSFELFFCFFVYTSNLSVSSRYYQSCLSDCYAFHCL